MITRKRTLKFAQLAILSAILFIMGFTPLGSIPIGPIVATIAQVPVVIGACTMGKKEGAFLGGVFGFVSMLYWFTIGAAAPTAFVFNPVVSFKMGDKWYVSVLFALASLIICYVPRILIGYVAGVIFEKLENKNEPLAYILSGIAGSLVNTILVLGLTLLFFTPQYSDAMGITKQALFTIVGTTLAVNGSLEAVVTPVLSYAIAKPVNYYVNKKRKHKA